MAKHLLDETAEFAMPWEGRHVQPDEDRHEPTQRFDAGFRPSRLRPEPRSEHRYR